LLATCLSLSACGRDVKTIWLIQAASPDGKWLAIGRADRHSGPGNAGIETGVYLRPTSASGEQAVLMFLNDLSPYNGGVSFALKWTAPSQLMVVFNRIPDINFEVVKYAGVNISIEGHASARGRERRTARFFTCRR